MRSGQHHVIKGVTKNRKKKQNVIVQPLSGALKNILLEHNVAKSN